MTTVSLCLPFRVVRPDESISLVLDIASKRPANRRGDKFRDILGEEAPQHYRNTVNADLKPWYLRPNYSQTDILIDYPDGAVRGGTVPALVERLTAHEHGGNIASILTLHRLLISVCDRSCIHQDFPDDVQIIHHS
jgi:hypothetical protein